MSNKQIACVVLAMIIAVMTYATLQMKTKLAAANQEMELAQSAANTAEIGRKQAQVDLDRKTTATQGLRDYLAEWKPWLMQTKTDADAQRMLTQKLKQDSLVIFSQRFDPLKLSQSSSISSAMRADITFEDDYHRLLNWIGSLESTLPTSRISRCRITKGQKGNDVKMELKADVPLSVASAK